MQAQSAFLGWNNKWRTKDVRVKIDEEPDNLFLLFVDLALRFRQFIRVSLSEVETTNDGTDLISKLSIIINTFLWLETSKV